MENEYDEEETVRLCLAYQTGDRAAGDELLRIYRKLVRYCFYRYARWTAQRLNVEADVLQEGCRGLLRAAEKFRPEKFRPEKGVWFFAYATVWIRSRMRRFIEENLAVIRTPIHLLDERSRARREQRLMNAPGSGIIPLVVSLDSATSYDLLGERTWADVLADERDDFEEYEDDERAALCRRLAPLILSLLDPRASRGSAPGRSRSTRTGGASRRSARPWSGAPVAPGPTRSGRSPGGAS